MRKECRVVSVKGNKDVIYVRGALFLSIQSANVQLQHTFERQMNLHIIWNAKQSEFRIPISLMASPSIALWWSRHQRKVSQNEN